MRGGGCGYLSAWAAPGRARLLAAGAIKGIRFEVATKWLHAQSGPHAAAELMATLRKHGYQISRAPCLGTGHIMCPDGTSVEQTAENDVALDLDATLIEKDDLI